MTTNEGFDRRLSAWLREDSANRVPDHLDEVLVRTVATRQRAWWSSPERWLPMQTTLHLAPVTRVAWLLVTAVLLLAVVAMVLYVGTQPRRPAPFGPARNGSLVYSGLEGDIYVVDPASGVSTALVTGPEIDVSPSFSGDGSRFAFGRETSVYGQMLLMVANADGTGIRALSEPFVGLDAATWSPDSSRLAVVAGPQGANSLSVVALDGTTVPILGPGLDPEMVQWRPDGRELVFRGTTYGQDGETIGLYVVGADGRGLRAILPPTDSPEHWQEPALSPDGTQIIYTQWDGDAYPGGHLYVVDVVTGEAQLLVFDGDIESDYYAEWSPDGSQIVFNRGTAQEKYYLAVGPAGGGHAVNIGPELPWDAAAFAVFSPDGSKVIARYSDGSNWIFDATSGLGQRLPATDFLGSWQRLAR